jgi:hypothetical protein
MTRAAFLARTERRASAATHFLLRLALGLAVAFTCWSLFA